MQLIPDVFWVLRKAWSIKLILIAGLLTGLETILPFLPELLGLSPRAYAGFTFIITMFALVARVTAQKKD